LQVLANSAFMHAGASLEMKRFTMLSYDAERRCRLLRALGCALWSSSSALSLAYCRTSCIYLIPRLPSVQVEEGN
jgi:hypothetical protein